MKGREEEGMMVKRKKGRIISNEARREGRKCGRD